MASTQETVEAYGVAWNEGDEAARKRLLDKSWADGGTYTDPQSHAEGRDALSAVISGFQRQMADARIVATSGVDTHHGCLRFTWKVEGANGATLMEGIDFGELAEDGRIKRIVGFFGPPPAG